MKKILAVFKHIDARDAHAYLGTAMLAVGCYLVYPPLGFIAPGVIFLYIAFFRR